MFDSQYTQMAGSGFDQKAIDALALKNLKRVDDQIEELLASTGHVSLYVMTVGATSWQQTQVEGSLHVVKRKTAPRFQMLVLNKKSTDNYTVPIDTNLGFESNPPYLLYTIGQGEVQGLWFYDSTDLENMAGVLQRITSSMPKEGSPAAPVVAAAAPSSSAEAGGDNDSFWDRQVAPEALEKQRAKLAANAPASAPAPAPPAPLATGGMSAKQLALMQSQAALQQHMASSAQPAMPGLDKASTEPTSAKQNLVHLLTKAKQQQTAEPQLQPAQAPAQPMGLPPSFFSTGPSASSSTQQPAVNRHLDQLRKGAALSPAPSQEVQREDSGSNPLAKFFPKATSMTVPPGVAPSPLMPHMVVAPSAVAAPSTTASIAAMTRPAASSAGSDREKVRALLNRMSTNVTLLDLLAGEMRAVGLL